MGNTGNIFGCFVSVTLPNPNTSQGLIDIGLEHGRLFRSYIWGDNGLSEILKKLKHEDYGKDLKLALFQFYVNPIPIEIQAIKEIEGYRKREKSIGISVIINPENFFNKSDENRCSFLKETILQRLDLLAMVVENKKLDTDMEQLKADLRNIL